MTDTPDWWEDVFSEREIAELEETANNIIDLDDVEDDEEGDGQVSVTAYIPVEKLADTLKGLMQTYQVTEIEEYKMFIHMLGVGIATEYFTDTDIEYEDTITAYANFFVNFDDLEDADDEDEDDDEEDE